MKHLLLFGACLLLTMPSLFGQACEPGISGYQFIDFDAFCVGQLIDANANLGTGLEDIHFSTVNTTNQSHPLVIFNSANPPIADDDLGSPNQNCPGGGPGDGPATANNCPDDWHPEEPGYNMANGTLGNILIMQDVFTDDGSCTEPSVAVPNDWAPSGSNTGTIIVTFDLPHTVLSLGFLDDVDIEVTAFQGNTALPTVTIASSIENIYQILHLTNYTDITRLEIKFSDSGALTHLEVCKQSGIFPLEFTDFQVVESGGEVTIDWITQSEQSSEYFEVQKSMDGKTFSTIETVSAQGSISQGYAYSTLDIVSNYRGNLFYRILQHNFDGTIDHSPIRLVSLGLDELSIFPNPTYNAMHISHTNAIQQVRIYNLQGGLMLHERESGTAMNIATDFLQHGIYFLEIRTEKETIRKRFQKM